MNDLAEENICKYCIHFHEIQSSEVVFTEREEVCDKLGITWPYEVTCEFFETTKE